MIVIWRVIKQCDTKAKPVFRKSSQKTKFGGLRKQVVILGSLKKRGHFSTRGQCCFIIEVCARVMSHWSLISCTFFPREICTQVPLKAILDQSKYTCHRLWTDQNLLIAVIRGMSVNRTFSVEVRLFTKWAFFSLNLALQQSQINCCCTQSCWHLLQPDLIYVDQEVSPAEQ